MSNPTSPVAAVKNATDEVKKSSRIQRSKEFVVRHRKPLIGGTALVGLMFASAALGRKTADLEVVVIDADNETVVETDSVA